MCEKYKNLLVEHLNKWGIYAGDEKWEIVENQQYGRCLIAKNDIDINETIFCDKALLYGPRQNNYEEIFCVSCYKILKRLTLCSNSCKFPLCESCENQEPHKRECELIRSWKFTNNARYSKHLFRALTIIRGLLLCESEEKIMLNMASHDCEKIKSIEVEKLLNEFEGLAESTNVVDKLKNISCILNTNAFELGVIGHNSNGQNTTISLRGLFPLAALMNHNCVPNIRYTYDNNKIMTCKASKLIKKGEQIFNSYTKILWGTNQRRMHLYYSKNFLCKCERCLDSTEFGSYISSIKCIRPGCEGHMVAILPLIVTSSWKCDTCSISLDHSRVSKIHDIVSKQIFSRIQNDSMSNNQKYLKEKMSTILPKNNQFTIELKLQIILKLQKDETYTMQEEDFNAICRYCCDILEALDKLKAGECFIKGLLFYEMAKTKVQIAELNLSNFESKTREDILSNLQIAFSILGNSISEPNDLKHLMELYSV